MQLALHPCNPQTDTMPDGRISIGAVPIILLLPEGEPAT